MSMLPYAHARSTSAAAYAQAANARIGAQLAGVFNS